MMKYINTVSAIVPLLIPIITGVFALSIAYVILGLVCTWTVALVLLLEGIILKLVNIKVKWRSFSIYSTVLLILSGIVIVLSLISTLFGVTVIGNLNDDTAMMAWMNYLTFSIGMVIFSPLGTVGALLEIIYRQKRKKLLRGFAVTLIVFAAFFFVLTIGVMIWAGAYFAPA
ncbi:MAG: hypothetical protein J1F09_08270 [Oscillospiraceae bacterium]|nr:hypothetical protein [Oscillospiraceae bacterium]